MLVNGNPFPGVGEVRTMGREKIPKGFRQRKDGRIEYRWTCEGKRYSVAGHSVEECREKAKRKQNLLGIGVDPSAITLNDYFDRWVAYREKHVKSSTVMAYRSVFKVIHPALGDMKVNRIERWKVRCFFQTLEGRYASSTIGHVKMLLSALFQDAISDGIIDRNPVDTIRYQRRVEPEARETIHRALTLEETEAFFKAAAERNSWYYNLYEFLISTGCRIGEAGALMRSDIDYKNNVIHIRRTITSTGRGFEVGDTPKTKTSKRDIPMNAMIREILQKQEIRNREMFGEDIIQINDRIFKSIGGHVVSSPVVIQDLKPILKLAGIQYFSPGAFRDTFATRAIEAGMNPQTLKEILGHSNYSMTMDKYVHTMMDTKCKEMGLLEKGEMTTT